MRKLVLMLNITPLLRQNCHCFLNKLSEICFLHFFAKVLDVTITFVKRLNGTESGLKQEATNKQHNSTGQLIISEHPNQRVLHSIVREQPLCCDLPTHLISGIHKGKWFPLRLI
jgi:hypothetical protein